MVRSTVISTVVYTYINRFISIRLIFTIELYSFSVALEYYETSMKMDFVYHIFITLGMSVSEADRNNNMMVY